MPFPGLVPVPLCLSEFLPKIGTHLLASSDIMEKNSNSCACLRNAGSYFAEWYCTREREREREREVFIGLQKTSGGLPSPCQQQASTKSVIQPYIPAPAGVEIKKK
eukprot:Tamp_38549.p1 GENE.Tamp_38549~~Tamp_38549.p1  ORF type:complete len:106 (+),score=5.10 Tamp_38549:176-493(+)